MACLALCLQPLTGPDLLLQTREWFHPARALIASSKFRETRESYSGGKRTAPDGAAIADGLGDEALAASGGQVIVGKESKFRVFYRLVNNIYVLGIASVDHDEIHANSFESAGVVNQAVSVLVAVCKGVDVTPDKLFRKYTEVYLALDMVLRGVSAARLAAILASLHGEAIPHMVVSATDVENRIRGADSWNQAKGQATEQLANIDVLSSTTFELPEETIATGDEVIATYVASIQTSASKTEQVVEEKPEAAEDPFAVSDKINRPEELAGTFKKSKEPTDVTSALADLEVPKTIDLTSRVVAVEGFEGDYGGLDFGEEGAAFGGAFEGLDDAFGGGLDASEFGAVVEEPLEKGLGGLEELQSGGKATAPKTADTGASVADNAERSVSLHGLAADMGKPVLYISEEVFVEFKGSKLRRIGLQGTVFVEYNGTQDTSFAFRLDGSVGIRRAIIRNSCASSLGKNLFHVRSSPAGEPLEVMKYRLHPRYTPLPLRVRLLTRQSGSLMSLMVQYVSNPFLTAPLRDVTFTVSLPYTPSLLKMSPKGSLSRHTKEIRWHIQEIPIKGAPGCLRAQMPLETDDKDETGSNLSAQKIQLEARVTFSDKGKTLSGITISPGTEGNTDFSVGIHNFKTATYSCT